MGLICFGSDGLNLGTVDCVSSLDFSAFCVVNYLRLSFYFSLVLFVYLCILCAAVMLITAGLLKSTKG